MDCPICFNEVNASTGRTTLGCGHEFHLRCIVEWFNNQEAACSCPCCRREQGEFDTVPIYPEEEDGEVGDDEEDDASAVSEDTIAFANSVLETMRVRMESAQIIDNVWRRQPNGRWVRLRIVREAPVTWSPADGTEPPAELKKLADDGATRIQSIWRGFATRKEQTTAAIKGASTILMALGISLE